MKIIYLIILTLFIPRIGFSSSCNVKMQKIVNFITIANSDYKIKISTDEACTSRLNMAMRLKHVEMALYKGNKLISKNFYERGFWSESLNKYILSKEINHSKTSCIPKRDFIQLDLESSIIKGPRLYFDLTRKVQASISSC
jgi:hypothetical protein